MPTKGRGTANYKPRVMKPKSTVWTPDAWPEEERKKHIPKWEEAFRPDGREDRVKYVGEQWPRLSPAQRQALIAKIDADADKELGRRPRR